MDTLEIGQLAEKEACSYLESKGLKLLARNYRCNLGEIDLIMRDKEDLVFIEVRKRSRADFALPVESINLLKQRKVIKTAMHYLQKLKWVDKVNCRFDVVGITGTKIDWIRDAFSADYY